MYQLGMVLVYCPRTNNVLAMYWVSTSPFAPSDSLYSLVLISQDFLFSCSICVNLQLAIPRSYLPRPLYSYLLISSLSGPGQRFLQDVCKPSLFHHTLTQTLDPSSKPLVPFGLDPCHVSSLCGGVCTSVTALVCRWLDSRP